jgi:hypothetical protein
VAGCCEYGHEPSGSGTTELNSVIRTSTCDQNYVGMKEVTTD